MSRRLVVALVVLIGCSLLARGQSNANPCINQPGTLYCLAPNSYGNGFVSPNPFTPVMASIGGQLSMVPLASPASGIVYVLDPSLKIPVAAGTETFGPVLVERGETLGARKLSWPQPINIFHFRASTA